MTGDLTAATFQPDLFQPERGLYLAPIRHHSPACAWALAAMIRDLKPAHVLVEAPVDLEHHIPMLLDRETVPPVALIAMTDGQDRLAAYYPFTAHSPEYVALKEAQKLGAQVRFIDLPMSEKAKNHPDPQTPLTRSEAHFDSGDYIAGLCQKTACRDGFELWDHLFEARLGADNWRGFFGDCGVYCTGIRAATPKDQIETGGDAAREAHMASLIAETLASAKGPVLVVVGGFHAPALTDPKASERKSVAPGKSYLIRYGYAAMDALAGYGAGLPQPGYYETLWQAAEHAGSTPDWAATSADIVEGFAQWLADQDRALSLPAKVEALRMAAGLAAMRGRDAILRHDLMDGLTTALVKGETGRAEIWAERLGTYLRGTKLGDVPASAGSPPLVEDARARARALRFDITDGAERRRKLDIRRKATQLDASRYLHAMALLDTGFARLEVGPDYVQDTRTDLLFEEWTYAWSPAVEGRLIEHATQADKLPDACIAELFAHRNQMAMSGTARDLEQLVDFLMRGILAGLADKLGPYLKTVSQDIEKFGTFDTVAAALQRLHLLANANGPLRIPASLDVAGAEAAAFRRLIYLCDTLPHTTEDEIPARLDALRLLNEVLAADTAGRLDRSLYDAALQRCMRPETPAAILGAILATSILSGVRPAEDLVRALEGNFTGSTLNETDRIGVLRGAINTAPQLLWLTDGVLDAVDGFLRDLDEEGFMTLLPHLRLAFSALNPRETDRLAALLSQIHGMGAQQFTAATTDMSAEDMARGLSVNASLLAELEADGLAAWITP